MIMESQSEFIEKEIEYKMISLNKQHLNYNKKRFGFPKRFFISFFSIFYLWQSQTLSCF